MTEKQSRFILAQAANAAERIAATLERFSRVEADANRAEQLEMAASDLAHHADAIREASGIHADTEANLATLLSHPNQPNMKQTLTTSQVADALRRDENAGWSYEAAHALFDYYEALETDSGEEIELDERDPQRMGRIQDRP